MSVGSKNKKRLRIMSNNLHQTTKQAISLELNMQIYLISFVKYDD